MPLKDIKNAFRAALRGAKIEGFRFHDLRHTAGTRMADAGVPITAIADILGHADVRTTMRYAHATEEAKRRAVGALEQGGNRKLSKIWPIEKQVAS
jgi:integrase